MGKAKEVSCGWAVWLLAKTCLLPIVILRLVVCLGWVVCMLYGAGLVFDVISVPWMHGTGVVRPSFIWLGLGFLTITAFWKPIFSLLRSRGFSVGPGVFSLTEPKEVASIGGTGLSKVDGTLRDNCLYEANYYFSKDNYEKALLHYEAAYRLEGTILAAFRAAQCLAHLGKPQEMMEWFYRALWHADGPWDKLKDRQKFVEWVRAKRSRSFDSICNDFANVKF